MVTTPKVPVTKTKVEPTDSHHYRSGDGLGILGFVGLRMAMRDEEDEDDEVIDDEDWEPAEEENQTQPDQRICSLVEASMN